MSWLSKAIEKHASFVDKQFSTKLAAKYRQIDPIARIMGEDYQRHIWHVSTGAMAGGGLAIMATDYYSGRNRGQDPATARRHTYQNQVKSAAILATIYGASAAAGGGGSSSGGAGVGATGEEASAVNSLYYTPAETGGAGLTPATTAGAEAVGGAGAVATTAPTTTATAPASGATNAGSGGGKVAAEKGLLSRGWDSLGEYGKGAVVYGGMQVAGNALQSANTPSAGEEAADIIAAKQRANRLSLSTSGGTGGEFHARTPTQPTQVNVMTPQQMLQASGYGDRFDPTNPTAGLLQPNNQGGVVAPHGQT